MTREVSGVVERAAVERQLLIHTPKIQQERGFHEAAEVLHLVEEIELEALLGDVVGKKPERGQE